MGIRKKVAAFLGFNGLGFDVMEGPASPGTRMVIKTSKETKENRYRTAVEQSIALYSMYNAESDFGQSPAKMIIDFLAQWMLGNGVRYSVADDPKNESREFQVLRELFGPDGALPPAILLRFAPAIIIEGRALFTVEKPESGFTPVVSYIPWISDQGAPAGGYAVEKASTGFGYAKIKRGGGLDIEKDFVYIPIGGVGNPNVTPSKLGNIASKLADLDIALSNMASVNRKFGLMPLHFEGLGENPGQSASQFLSTVGTYTTDKDGRPVLEIHLDIGDTTGGGVKAYFVEPSDAGSSSFSVEVENLVQIISGGSTVPPHFFGFVKMFSNRATAEELHEVIVSGNARDRTAIEYGMQQLAKLWFKMRSGENLDFSRVQITVPSVSLQQIKMLVDVYGPLTDRKVISKKTLRGMVGDIDQDVESERLGEEANADRASLSDFTAGAQGVNDGG